MSTTMLPRRLTATAAAAAVMLGLVATLAHATEIPAPRRSSAGTASSDAASALERWVSAASDGVVDARASSIVSVEDDAIRFSLGTPYGAQLAPLPVDAAAPSPTAEGFDMVIGSTGGAALNERLAAAVTPSGAELAGGTRFDVRPADRNAISLPGTVVDRLVLRVVRTPEPTTLALFAMGVLGLGLVVRRRRRVQRASPR